MFFGQTQIGSVGIIVRDELFSKQNPGAIKNDARTEERTLSN
jgi:hypothetical protein